ncbi:succinate dehydrogenase complex subunit C [Echinococcus multilocularis]|uniref:Succinate dehydrogenase complex subunit C n=1 Tax=Echinococcus multilocularis TaxID=6211 RepID=A0A068YIU3_ECHMU|nr:succinate dehydrogenase complex subunit C [Echinococcus multilocularis]
MIPLDARLDMSVFANVLLRAHAAPFRGVAARNLSMALQPLLLRTAPVLSATKHYKGSTSEEVRLKAESEMQDYWERNIKLKRPWSPHILIYSPPLCTRNSFLHRATGVAMAIVWMGAGAAGFWYTGHFDGMLDYVSSFSFGPSIVFGAKCLLAYPLVYHYCNGMRHLAWDYAIGFDMKTVNMTGATVLILSFLLTLALASIRS